MLEFDESKHKRDELGRFAKMSASELKERQTINLLDSKKLSFSNTDRVDLTKQEWALWYKAVAESKILGCWTEAKGVFSFDSVDEMNDFVEVLKYYDDE